MSRVAKKPIDLPKGVEITVIDETVRAKGPKGELSMAKPAGVGISIDGQLAQVETQDAALVPMAGTVRAILANMIQGVTQGFERKLELVGVGYRASMQGRDLNLALGYSHPILFTAPEGITLTTPTQTEILVAGNNKQLVGEVAAKIRSFRKPEPYKGKGVKYAGEKIIRKEAKKA